MLHHAKRAIHNDQKGFTVIELVAALAITSLLGIAVVTVIIGVLESNGKTQINAATTVQAQHVLMAFERNAKQAEELISASRHGLQFFYRADNRCELHTYQFVPDSENPKKLALFHSIQSGFVPGTVDCSMLKDNILTSGSGAITTRTELSSLGANSRFVYYAENGDVAPRPGYAEFQVNDQVVPCKIAAVEIVLETTAIAGDSTYENEDAIKTSIQSGAKGVACLPE